MSVNFSSYQRNQRYSFVNIILLITIVGFLSTHVVRLWFRSSFIDYTFALSGFAIEQNYWWSFITYAFLHGNFWHLFFNLLFFYFIGKELEFQIGTKKLFFLYFVSTIVAGIFWFLLNFEKSSFLIGASGSVLGVFCYYCCLYPNRPMTFLFFFIIPITIKPKNLLMIVFGYELLSLLFTEQAGTSAIANSAHIGGLIGGGICFLIFNKISFSKNFSKKKVPSCKYHVNLNGQDSVTEKLNKILDKINESGFGSLTTEEKQFLDEAKDLLKKR